MDKRDAALKIELETRRAVDVAMVKLSRAFPYPEVGFTVRGRVAGRANTRGFKIEYNLPLAIDNLEKFLDDTVWHEVGHIVADNYFGKRCNHGHHWKWVMKEVFGREPQRCHNYDVSKHLVRRVKRYAYQCSGCGNKVSAGPKHHRILQTPCPFHILRCRRCKTVLKAGDLLGLDVGAGV